MAKIGAEEYDGNGSRGSAACRASMPAEKGDRRLAGDYAPPRPPRVPCSSWRSIILSALRWARSRAPTCFRTFEAQPFPQVAARTQSISLPQQMQRSSSS